MDDFVRAARFINSHPWRFASTMRDIPHSYVMRDWCSDRDEFNWFDGFIHSEGETGFFGKRQFKYLYLNGYKYWDCGDQRTIENLINRDEYSRNFRDQKPQEVIGLFAAQDMEEEDSEVADFLRGRKFSTVYNPSCGTGRMYDILTAVNPECAGRYIGSDSRHSRLVEFKTSRNPHSLHKDKANHLYFGQMDLVVTLEAEQLNAYALRRIGRMVSDGGEALLFSKEKINFWELDKYGVAGRWSHVGLKHWHLLTIAR